MDHDRWRRVSRIAADAMELKGAARTTYLEHACGEDFALRAEVDRILSAHDGFDSLLDRTTSEVNPLPLGPSHGSHSASIHPSSVMRGLQPSTAPSEDARLPAELTERAARRLGTLAILFAAGFIVAYVVREVTVHGIGGAPYVQRIHTPGQVMTAFFALLAVGMAMIARNRSVGAPRLVSTGLVFEVVGSLGIGLVSYSGLWHTEGSVWGVSWLCVWIMMFPLVIPAPPGAAALAAFASAAMAPLAILVWAATRGFTFPPIESLLAATIPNFVVAALACLGAGHLYRVGRELYEAKRLGRYRLVAPLGRGGMGEVWIAEHDLLARPAALKLIRPALLAPGKASSEVVTGFEREAQSTAALSSPHTVRLYDFGLTEDGLFYYVMELLKGLDLDALVRRTGPVTPARAVHFLRQACSSLAEAHALGLVHRDIKPSNLFVCRQGLELDVLKVLDFGIVRPSTDRIGTSAASGASEAISGTPAFMAPESALGTANAGTDLYALGCVAYWLLTGHPVFEDDGPAESSPSHRGEIPTPPSLRMGRDMPAALDALIMACLEKDPARRPRSAELLDALLAAVPGPAWSQEQAREWWKAQSATPSGPRA
jgi:eukaryotic-like serine/threonine-protein kinase